MHTHTHTRARTPQGLTFAAGWAAACASALQLAPRGLAATLQGLATAAWFGAGAGAGALLGGQLLQAR